MTYSSSVRYRAACSLLSDVEDYRHSTYIVFSVYSRNKTKWQRPISAIDAVRVAEALLVRKRARSSAVKPIIKIVWNAPNAEVR